MENFNNTWNFIVNAVNNGMSYPETYVQKKWVDILHEILGYSKLFGEIKEQEKIFIGSHERTIPDILITQNGKSLFVVELKCYNMPKQDKYVEQLKSYMKLLDLEIGVLVCNKLYIFCKDTNGEYPYIEIPFEKDNKNGEWFVESFSKKNFNTDFIKDFILEYKKRQEETETVRKALDEICADGEGFLKNYLAEKYSAEAVNCVFEEYKVNIQIKSKYAPIIIDLPAPTRPDDPGPKFNKPTLTKKEAIELFRKRGYDINPNHTTFASKNQGNYTYWANPNFSLLRQNWYLILNDWPNRTLYLFSIPANSISESELVPRNDQPEKIDMDIYYNDPIFTDSRSKYKFMKYKIAEINY